MTDNEDFMNYMEMNNESESDCNFRERDETSMFKRFLHQQFYTQEEIKRQSHETNNVKIKYLSTNEQGTEGQNRKRTVQRSKQIR